MARHSRGARGRVTATMATAEGERLEVRLVGIGVVRVQREQIAATKVGQLRYARRRHAAWTALAPCIVLEAVVGSRAWGLAFTPWASVPARCRPRR